jgi:hypothetical protein
MGVDGRVRAVQRGCPGIIRSSCKNQLNLFTSMPSLIDSGCAQGVEVTESLDRLFGWRGWDSRQRDCMQKVRKSAGVEPPGQAGVTKESWFRSTGRAKRSG